ncbi:MAG: phosphatidate cytidylyltransferase, partial [Gemmatimonadota bacterium]
MLKTRVITAVVLLACLAGALWAGATAFAAAMAVLLGAGVFEWMRLAQHGAAGSLLAAIGFAVAVFALQATRLATPAVVLPAAAIALLVWVGLFTVLVRAERGGVHVPRSVSSILCILLLGVAALSALQLMQQGVTLLVSALAIVWIADTA